jgi:hypothetical protein
MTQEEKDLLLKDLCARLPYGVKVAYLASTYDVDYIESKFDEIKLENLDCTIDLGNVKPYLRPMSSMTEEEKEEMHKLLSPKGTAQYDIDGIRTPMSHYGDFIPYKFMDDILQYLNKHHFDYRGLIEKGLALEAPEGMYGKWTSLRGNLKEDTQGNIVGGLKL